MLQDDNQCLLARRALNIEENNLLKQMIGLVSKDVAACHIIFFLTQSPGVQPTTLTSEVTKLKEKLRALEVY